MAERTKLSHVAYDRFKERLFSSDVRPGQFVSQRELVGLTGVPLAPVREALLKLETEGLVHIVPQRGVQVAEANLKLIRNTFHLRMIVEKEATRRYAEHAPSSQIDQQIDAHQDILNRHAHHIDDQLISDWQEVDMRLHHEMVEFLGNDLLIDIHRVNMDRIRLIRLDQITPSSLESSMQQHLAVLEACKRRDLDAAEQAIDLHVSVALRHAMGL